MWVTISIIILSIILFMILGPALFFLVSKWQMKGWLAGLKESFLKDIPDLRHKSDLNNNNSKTNQNEKENNEK